MGGKFLKGTKESSWVRLTNEVILHPEDVPFKKTKSSWVDEQG